MGYFISKIIEKKNTNFEMKREYEEHIINNYE